MSFTAAKSKASGRGEAAVWFPDGDMAAEVHGNLGAYPDPIDAVELAELFAQAPTLQAERDALLLWMTENLTVDQVRAATSFVLSRR